MPRMTLKRGKELLVIESEDRGFQPAEDVYRTVFHLSSGEKIVSDCPAHVAHQTPYSRVARDHAALKRAGLALVAVDHART